MQRSGREKRSLLQITDGGKMDKLFKGQHIIPSYETEDAMLVFGDTFQVLDKMKSQSVDLIFADPPYFLSNGGFTCSGGKQVSVNKGDWDAADGWPAKHRFNRRWLHRPEPAGRRRVFPVHHNPCRPLLPSWPARRQRSRRRGRPERCGNSAPGRCSAARLFHRG